MLKHNIAEKLLPKELKIVNKEDILSIIKGQSSGSGNESIPQSKKNPVSVKPKEKPITQDTSILDNSINYLEYKVNIPHIYFSNQASVDNLLNYLDDINTKHKKGVKIEDFIAKVLDNNNYIRQLVV